MVPTPITRHSTRASSVKVGPKIAIPRAMFSLTSSWNRQTEQMRRRQEEIPNFQHKGTDGGCFCSVIKLCPALGDPMDCSTPGFPVLHYLHNLLKFMSIKSIMPTNHLSLCQPFLSYPQSFQTSGSFPMSQLFESGGQSIGALASVSVLPINIQDWFPLG